MDKNELLSLLRDVFFGKCDNDKTLQKLEKALETGTYDTANDYSIRVGELLAETFGEVLDEETYSLLDEDIVRAVIPSLLGSDHKKVSNACMKVQKHLNQEANIGIKAMPPDFDVDRTYGLVDKFISYDKFEDAKWVLQEPVINYSQSIVDKAVRKNADFHYRSGMSPKIIRTAVGGCCKWCSKLAGSYAYESVSGYDKHRINKAHYIVGHDVFRRHENCRCTVTYEPIKGIRENVHTKQLLNKKEIIKQNIKEKSMELFQKEVFNSRSDPMAEVFGRGIDSNPIEIDSFKKECHESGVSVIVRDNEIMQYQPSPIIGKPGQLVIWDGASYSAWLHEMVHMRDDRESGWKGAIDVWDKEVHMGREIRAYNAEIELAEMLGRIDIADRLRENLNKEIRRIYDE